MLIYFLRIWEGMANILDLHDDTKFVEIKTREENRFETDI